MGLRHPTAQRRVSTPAKNARCPRAGRQRQGAMLPLIAVCLVILFCSVVMSIDIARIHVTRAELRTATDAAARAAAEALGRTQSIDDARNAALQVAQMNTVAGRPLTLRPDQVDFGSSVEQPDGLIGFQLNASPTNTVRVTGTRTADSIDGPVGLLFAPIFGLTQFEPRQIATATRLDRDIALVLDVSGSMAEDNRFGGLVNALRLFLAELEDSPQRELVSLTVYSTTGRKKVALTDDLDAIVDSFRTERPNGFTAIGEGLQLGINSVKNDPAARRFAEKTVVCMTDGFHNRGISPDVVANRTTGVTIHTVTLGPTTNEALMLRVAQSTPKGIHLHATDNAQLEAAFKEIARQLSVLLIE